MSSFRGTLISRSVENHVLVIFDQKLLHYGIGSFSKKGFEEFRNSKYAADVATITGRAAGGDMFSFLGVGGGEYIDFGKKPTKVSVTTGQLNGFIAAWEQLAENEDFDTLTVGGVNAIQNSLYGCVYLPTIDSPVAALYFYDIGSRKNSRILANSGPPMITDTPRRTSGARYNYNATRAFNSKIPNYGTFIDLKHSVDPSNPEANVTAPLRISYNDNLGVFESNPSMLAKLVTDLLAVPDKDVNLNFGDLKQTEHGNKFKSEHFYDQEEKWYLGAYTTALAIPLSMKGGCPRAYGPNIIAQNKIGDDDYEWKIESVRVVNRSNVEFKKGEKVMLTSIDGEWIAQKFGDPPEKPVTEFTFGRWGFSKFIASSDEYFRDYPGGPVASSALTFAKDVRRRFYASITNHPDYDAEVFPASMKTLNGAGSTASAKYFHPYTQVTIYDHLDAAKNGYLDKDMFHRTNFFVSPGTGDSTDPTSLEMPMFWGPSFPDGSDFSMGVSSFPNPIYGSVTFDEFQSPAEAATLGDYPDGVDVFDGFPIEDGYKIIKAINESNTAEKLNDLVQAGFGYFIFPSGADTEATHLPKTLDTQENSFGLYADHEYENQETIPRNYLEYQELFGEEEGEEDEAVTTGPQAFINSTSAVKTFGRLTKTYKSSGDGGATPNSRNRITFIPLCNELAAADDPNAIDGKIAENQTRFDFDRRLRDMAKLLAGDAHRTPKYMGNAYARSAGGGYPISLPIPPDAWAYGEGLVPGGESIKYDGYIEHSPTDSPSATTSQFSGGNYKGSNCVGIIAARQKIQKSGGGTINFDVSQYFGLHGKSIGLGSFDPGLTILPIGGVGVGWSMPSVGMSPKYSPVWGSSLNSYRSFGTVALHVMIWDAWPDHLTVFVPQYFSVLHFNPGKLFSVGGRCDVDFFETTLRKGAVVSCSSTPATIKNVVRRGQLLTEDGFIYKYKTISLNAADYEIVNGGRNFQVNNILKSDKNVKIRVTSVGLEGKITAFSFEETDDKMDGTGEGFRPTNFCGGYILQVFSGLGDAAQIKFNTGKVKEINRTDIGPRMRVGPTLITSKSSVGNGSRISISKNNQIGIEANDSSQYPGRYEVFYLFHNDIMVVPQTAQIESQGGLGGHPIQHVTVDIT